jgi:hypothetical protein
MRRFVILSSLVCLASTIGVTASAQQCELDIVGTWKAVSPVEDKTVLYRFEPDGTILILSQTNPTDSAPVEIGKATYKLDNPKTPKEITFNSTKAAGVLVPGMSSMEITTFDDSSFTCVYPGSAKARWVRVDSSRYFIVLAARSGAFYDSSGPAFPVLVRLAPGETRINAIGVYSNKGKRAFGPVPPESYGDLIKDPRSDSDVMLRLEINPAQYQRGLRIFYTWERRVRDGELLYAKKGSLDNILLVKEVVESLNQCSDKFKLYKLNYVYDDDWISNKYGAPFVPFHFFKELRRLNDALHVKDDDFNRLKLSISGPDSPDGKAVRSEVGKNHQ